MHLFEPGSSEDLEDLYENAPCGYLSLRPDGRIIKVNRTLCTWLGKSPDELVGKRLRDLLNVAGSIFYETHFAPLLRMQGFYHEVALDMIRADGSKLPVLANATERRDDDGSLMFTRITIFQATERRRFERELVDAREGERRARKELENLVVSLREGMDEQTTELLEEREGADLREQFIAVLGHDLRNPLASIDAGLRRLERDAAWNEKTPQLLRLMKNSVTRMSGLIDNVLDLARSRLGGGIALALDGERPLQPTLEQVVDEIRTAHPERSIEAEIDIPRLVEVDHQRVAQMFSNLLGNAVAHGAGEGTIRISAALEEDGVLALSVANPGQPIPEEMVQHLFKAFHRGQVRSDAQGLGLGLYIASQIAEAHGGRIEVHSDDIETRFTFKMPTS
jgi:sigma-B regulation protein RsbU (phosphoserine phosphatase)